MAVKVSTVTNEPFIYALFSLPLTCHTLLILQWPLESVCSVIKGKERKEKREKRRRCVREREREKRKTYGVVYLLCRAYASGFFLPGKACHIRLIHITLYSLSFNPFQIAQFIPWRYIKLATIDKSGLEHVSFILCSAMGTLVTINIIITLLHVHSINDSDWNCSAASRFETNDLLAYV